MAKMKFFLTRKKPEDMFNLDRGKFESGKNYLYTSTGDCND